MDPSVKDAYEILQQEYPENYIAVSCNKHDDDDTRVYWGVYIREIKPAKCPHCMLPEKVTLAAVYVAETFDEALEDVRRQMKGGTK